MFSQLEAPPLERGITWSTVRLERDAAVLAGPAVAGEHGAAGDLAPVGVARDVHVADTSRITTGRAMRGALGVELPAPALDSSALSLSSSTTARRTEQTLIGSNVALRTSTRPLSRPRRRCSEGGADPTGAGGTVLPSQAQCSDPAATRSALSGPALGRRGRSRARARPRRSRGARRPRRRRGRPGGSPGGRRRTCSARAARVGPRLDLGQVDLAPGELVQAADEPAGAVGAGTPEDERCLRPALRGGLDGRPRRRRAACEPDEASRVVVAVLDVARRTTRAVDFGREPRAERRPTGVRRRRPSARPRRWSWPPGSGHGGARGAGNACTGRGPADGRGRCRSRSARSAEGAISE